MEVSELRLWKMCWFLLGSSLVTSFLWPPHGNKQVKTSNIKSSDLFCIFSTSLMFAKHKMMQNCQSGTGGDDSEGRLSLLIWRHCHWCPMRQRSDAATLTGNCRKSPTSGVQNAISQTYQYLVTEQTNRNEIHQVQGIVWLIALWSVIRQPSKKTDLSKQSERWYKT